MSLYLKRLIFLINALGLGFHGLAQENIPLGSWRVHLPYTRTTALEWAGNRLYANSTINAFYIDKQDNSTNILSKVNALSDVSITRMRYHAALNMLVLGYENGNIDIIKDNNTINIDDIVRKNMTGSKRINDITFFGNYAYLSCDFGLSLLDLERLEIKETYFNLDPSGLPNYIYSCAFSSKGDSIFIASQRGIMVASTASSVNRMDYKNWLVYDSTYGLPTSNVAGIVNFRGTMYAAVSSDTLYYLMGKKWYPTSLGLGSVRTLRVSNDKLIICHATTITIADNKDSYYTLYNSGIADAWDAIFDGNDLWIGDYWFGLIKLSGNTITSHRPNGPFTSSAFSLSYYNDNIVVCAGGYTRSYNFLLKGGEFYQFHNGSWTTYNKDLDAKFPPYNKSKDLTASSYSSVTNKLYFITYGLGIMVVNPDSTYEVIDNTTAPFNRATDAEPDKDGNLWVADMYLNTPSDCCLHVLQKNGTWKSKSFNRAEAQNAVEIVIDDNNYKWIRLLDGLIVYDDKTGKYRFLSDQIGQGSMPSKTVVAMAKDRNGDMWIATDKGITIFYNTNSIFSGVEATIPIYEGFDLLYNETITCIKVDGGNRKWIGTTNGLWLFNPDGSELISRFTIDNSPLLSNTITDMAIHEITGEVFIGTDKGVISYRGDATAGSQKHSNVKIFPNPILPDFRGWAGISGLVTDATVKITDVYGNLVYQTKAEGGIAKWNVKDYNGARAQAGIYLVFSASEDGTETYVGKVAVID